MKRPEYRHSRFGIEFYSIETGEVLYAWNADELFIPGSTTKILAVGSTLELLGPDFRFRTKIYRTGNLDPDGTLRGDLILRAAGDPNLSGRLRPDATLAFEDDDHSYDSFADARPVARRSAAGDPGTGRKDRRGRCERGPRTRTCRCLAVCPKARANWARQWCSRPWWSTIILST